MMKLFPQINEIVIMMMFHYYTIKILLLSQCFSINQALSTEERPRRRTQQDIRSYLVRKQPSRDPHTVLTKDTIIANCAKYDDIVSPVTCVNSANHKVRVR